MFPLWAVAGFWGAVAGSALIMGALAGYLAPVPRRVVAGIMAFGAGVLISALAFELMDEAYKEGGVLASSAGLVTGALTFAVADAIVSRHGGKHRKRSGHHQEQTRTKGSGLVIALGSLMDGIPESLAIGASLVPGGSVAWVTIAAVFLSNIPEGMSSSLQNIRRLLDEARAAISTSWSSTGRVGRS